MQAMYDRCAGFDVQKDTVVACVVKGPGGTSTTRTFETATRELPGLRDWLDQERVTHVAVELWVNNVHHEKNLPDVKTDVKDRESLADLLRHGLVKPSFVPDTPPETFVNSRATGRRSCGSGRRR